MDTPLSANELYEAEHKLQNCIRITLSVETYETEVYTGERWVAVATYVEQLIQQEIAKTRRSERLEVALDNYRGQTFSESTDYKSKFDRFVRNNERRLEQLTLKEHKED